MQRITEWVRWEFGRKIEVTTGIRLITIERFLKAAVLIIGGILLAVLSTRTDMHRMAQDLQTDLNLTPGRGWVANLYQATIAKWGQLSTGKQVAVAVGAILYGCLEALEGVGLLLRRRWAEYLVLIATVVFLPIEIEEVIRKPTLLKVGALIVNLLIIGYLIWRKRLFLERPGHMVADRTQEMAADPSLSTPGGNR
jgi:uncharacterized membrane protein (DUF2068 family)